MDVEPGLAASDRSVGSDLRKELAEMAEEQLEQEEQSRRTEQLLCCLC